MIASFFIKLISKFFKIQQEKHCKNIKKNSTIVKRKGEICYIQQELNMIRTLLSVYL